MKRSVESEDLMVWKNDPIRMPLLLRGSRQVGKSFLIEKWGRQHFKHFLMINFEQQREYLSCFTSLDLKHILTSITALSGQPIIINETLLFLDEIQECPSAIMALRYFKEQMPLLHVIGAGSLLEFALKKEGFHMPVGRIQSLYIKPLSFYEYLSAIDQEGLIQYLGNIALNDVLKNNTIDDGIHQKLERYLREYFVLGGMPAVIQSYLTSETFDKVPLLQHSLLTTYRDDFGKYAPMHQHKYLQRILEQAPSMVGETFRYAGIDAHMQSRDLKPALDNLIDAGLIYRIHRTQATGLPLNASINEKSFKILFLDIGLVKATSFLSPQLMLKEDLMLINRGMLVEQFVGQELLAYAPRYVQGQLFYWARDKKGSQAEVDYIIHQDETIIPMEVKAGKTGSLRSLHYFLNHFSLPLGIHLSLKPLQLHHNILSIPLYMIAEIPRLITEFL